MKRLMLVMAVAVMAALGWNARGAEWIPLSAPEAAWQNATHVWVIKYTDLTETTTNTLQTLTNTVAANQLVEFESAKLITAWDTASTSYTYACELTVGDGTDTNLFLESMELASEGTEVYAKKAPPHSVTVSYTSAVLTNVLYNSITGNVTVVTGVTAAGTVGELGRKLYTSAGAIVATFKPSEYESLDAATQGEIRLYFRVYDPALER